VSDGSLTDYEDITITVNEVNLPPVLNAIGAKSVNELATLSFTATASDADIPVQTLTFSLGPGAPSGASITSGGAFTWTPTEAQGPGVYTIRVIVSDGSLTDYEDISVTVNEVNVAPVLNPIGPKSINELSTLSFTATASDSDLPAQTLTFSLGSGAPSGASITSSGAFSWTPTEAQGPGVYTIRIIVSDGSLTDYEDIVVTVNEVNTPPVLNPIGPKSVIEGNTLSFTATASDSDLPAQTLTFSLGSGAPSGASITSAGAFSWTPTEAQGPGVYNINITVSDGVAIDYEVITVTVYEANTPPVLDPIGPKTVDELSTLSFTATATDSDIPAQTLTFSLGAGAPSGASITSGGAFTWAPTEAQGPGVYNINITVSDGIAIDYEVITVTVNEVNLPPVLNPIGAKTVNELSLLTFTATASDPDIPAQTLTFSLGSGAPAGASINPTTGVFTWTPTEAQGPGVYTIRIIVSDGSLTDYEDISVTVNEVNVAPVLNPIGSKTIDELATLSFTATASDSDLPAQTLTFSLGSGAPSGASITSAGVFTWTPTEAQGPGSFVVRIIVSDGSLTDYEDVTITVNEVNLPPVLNLIGSKTVTEGTLLQFTITASDPDLPAQTLAYLASNLPSGATFNPTTRVFSWQPTIGQAGVYSGIHFEVSDGLLTDSEDITITVKASSTSPVGGYSISLKKQAPTSNIAAYTMLIALFGAALILIKRKRK
jgi:methyl coenzyme M reductase subunit C